MKKLFKVNLLLFAFIVAAGRLQAQSMESPISSEIKKHLTNGVAGLYYPKTVKRFYDQYNFKPAWIKPQRGEGHAWQAMLMLDCVLQYGLSHADYHPKELSYDLLHNILDTPGKVSIKTQAWFDIMLTDAIVNFMNNLHYGKLNPYYTHSTIDQGNVNGFNADAVLIQALMQKDIMNPLAAVQPMSTEYLEMLRHMVLLKGRYDGDCYEVPESTIRKLAINMERMRWANIDQQTYIHINIPSYTLMFHQPDTTYLFRAIVGTPKSPTPALVGVISLFTTMPEWQVPSKIFLKELIPKALTDTKFFDNNNFTIRDKKGEEVMADSKNIAANPREYTATQKSGTNPLGRVVFRFPNIYNISIHDTPEKALFSKKIRALSHSCIRIEQAEKLAILILKNDGNAEKILALHKNLSNKKTQNFYLSKVLPLKITYLTCAVIKGEYIAYDDVYNLDEELEKSLYRY